MDAKSYYSEKSAKYAISAGRRQHILDLISKSETDILDIGCAAGGLARHLKSLGKSVWGIDISSDAIGQAQSHLVGSFVFNVEQESWPAELMARRFDLIIASEIIEHLFDPKAFLVKAMSLLRPDGAIIITTPNVLFWKNRLKMLFGIFKYEESGLMDFGHIRMFTATSIKQLAKEVGLGITREHHYYPNLEHRRMSFLGRVFPGLFSYQLIVKAKPLS